MSLKSLHPETWGLRENFPTKGTSNCKDSKVRKRLLYLISDHLLVWTLHGRQNGWMISEKCMGLDYVGPCH